MTSQSVKTLITYLSGTDLFGGLPGPMIERLADSCSLRTFSKRRFIFHEGDPGESAWLLIRGGIQLTRQTESGKDIVIRTVKPGEFFAEVILFDNGTYPVSAEVLVESRCVQMRRSAFRRLLENTDFRDRFIGLLMNRQRYLAARVQYLTMFDLEERFFRFLQDQYGDSSVIQQTMAKKDVAAAIGTTPESLSRLVRRLTDEGRIRWRSSTLHRYSEST